jgi:altronate dehydratase large subunit
MGETTEFIGAEHLVAKRAKDDRVRRAFLKIVSRMEDRIKALGFDMRGSQPTQGNIAGGITTIEEKSLGAVAKGGTAPIMGVLEYSARPPGRGST